ncbi:4970_t:CDS:2 [Cetraspora pellucida]|uniref:4970_t:CDS:1 n=1 Tax=Cetraspora pellucida TaxID=1433469 RepID=A0ACA9N003_9GLOM|nr:4970_t:CDS:2 [Cetraspora pellucida]
MVLCFLAGLVTGWATTSLFSNRLYNKTYQYYNTSGYRQQNAKKYNSTLQNLKSQISTTNSSLKYIKDLYKNTNDQYIQTKKLLNEKDVKLDEAIKKHNANKTQLEEIYKELIKETENNKILQDELKEEHQKYLNEIEAHKITKKALTEANAQIKQKNKEIETYKKTIDQNLKELYDEKLNNTIKKINIDNNLKTIKTLEEKTKELNIEKNKYKTITEKQQSKKQKLPILISSSPKTKVSGSRQLNDGILTESSSKIRKITKCSLGSCGDQKDFNICQTSRPFGFLSDKIEFAKEKFEPVDKRYYFYSLLQDLNKPFTSLRLLDFVAQFKLVSFTPPNSEKIQLPGNEDNIQLTPLFSPFKINLYLVQICDEKLAKKLELTIEDVLIDPSDIKYHKFKDTVIPVLDYSVVIPCDNGCAFNDHVITMCRKFSKDEEKVCILSKETGESIIYNTANLRLILIIDYMDFLYQLNVRKKDMPYSEKIKLGEDATKEGTGYPVFFTDGFIEIAYTLDYQNYSSMQMMTQQLKTELTDAVKELIKDKIKEEEEIDDV